MFAKLIVIFILIYLYVCVVLCTSIQSYFTFHVQFLKFLWLSMCSVFLYKYPNLNSFENN